ncbi:hypothetical protein [Chryseobacterium luquanense]|uniref:Uncharacterized protein n=1 Tax=Chryseobacterium luquanense TaxID=2983766 RepID=A0ABT3Y968_9FLAO|nr:hypothetical protein [Chryseobacterium luquanense]MCX8534662.1 hypothetical protein [Chryseobacterium luquanense]
MENNNFCCDGLSTAINNTGKRGFSILIKMSGYDKSFYFVQQYRSTEDQDMGILNVGEVAISYCPWCGCNLDKIIEQNRTLVINLYEINKEFLLGPKLL